jgi:hypothetical protein
LIRARARCLPSGTSGRRGSCLQHHKSSNPHNAGANSGSLTDLDGGIWIDLVNGEVIDSRRPGVGAHASLILVCNRETAMRRVGKLQRRGREKNKNESLLTSDNISPHSSLEYQSPSQSSALADKLQDCNAPPRQNNPTANKHCNQNPLSKRPNPSEVAPRPPKACTKSSLTAKRLKAASRWRSHWSRNRRRSNARLRRTRVA